MVWHINILTLFPEMFPGSLGHSLSGKALENGVWSYNAINIRDFAKDPHKTVDDTPYGGGAGMVMRPDVIEAALLSINHSPPYPPAGGGEARSAGGENYGRLIYLSPRGKPLTQALTQELSQEPTLTLLCGRYEGVDQRVLDTHEFEEVSIGDYVLSGGEPAALILMDACIRLLPGVMGNDHTADEESFSNGLLEYPHYTRPADWAAADGKTHSVPDILKSGNHGKIAQWRQEQSKTLTKQRRPDLLPKNEENA